MNKHVLNVFYDQGNFLFNHKIFIKCFKYFINIIKTILACFQINYIESNSNLLPFKETNSYNKPSPEKDKKRSVPSRATP